MTSPVELADRLATAQRLSVRLSAVEIARLWSLVDVADIDGTWLRVLRGMSNAVALGQLRAAIAGDAYVAAVLALDGLTPQPEAQVPPGAFVGYTSAGLPLDNVLSVAPIKVKQLLLSGATLNQALFSGKQFLQLLSATETADAGRGSVEAATRLDHQIAGYERRVRANACSRCMILAGKFFKVTDGFKRHPGCDCTHVAITEKAYRDRSHKYQSPQALFDGLSTEEQNARFTQEGARAIRHGADPSSIVNARWQHSRRGNPSGMSEPGALYTTAGRTVRSQFGRQEKAAGRVVTSKVVRVNSKGQTRTRKKQEVVRQRLSPQGVARIAGDDHALYMQLLRDNAYI